MTRPGAFKWAKTSPEVIRLAVLLYARFRRMRTLQTFATVHGSVTKHFNSDRSLSS